MFAGAGSRGSGCGQELQEVIYVVFPVTFSDPDLDFKHHDIETTPK